MVSFLWEAWTLDSDLMLYLIASVRIFAPGGAMSNAITASQETFAELEKLHSKHDSLASLVPVSQRNRLKIETDKAINASFALLVTRIRAGCTTALHENAKALLAADKATTLGAQLAAELDPELSRVEDILRQLPLWFAWSPMYWTGTSDRARYRAYLKFLRTEAPALRALTDVAAAIHGNLGDVGTYCLWYSANATFSSVHADPLRDGTPPVTLEGITRNIDGLLERVRDAQKAGRVDPQTPSWSPRRVHAAFRPQIP
ncbi:hypothetical protein C8R44DRAFT_394261 [Mycena epipterygia]|nr:hypothetical protein C8R44DRAFT_394261 [Mycena epipterygia]